MLMKRMLLLAVLAGIAAGTAGCKQQDAPKLDRQAVRLYVGDQVRITADRPVAWSAADDFYAAVDGEGTVTARHVGTTTVTATADSGSAACTVEVQPRYDTFEEPIIELLMQPMEVIKSLEPRKIIKTEQVHNSLRLVSVEEDNPKLAGRTYYCALDGEGCYRITRIYLTAYTKYQEEIIGFLEERYTHGEEGSNYYYPGNNFLDVAYRVAFLGPENPAQKTVEIYYHL